MPNNSTLNIKINTKAKLSSKDLETIARYIKRQYKLDVPVKLTLAKPKKSAKITIYSPTKLSDQEVKHILAYLKKQHQIEAPVQTKIDKSLLGGVKITYKDLEFDLTLDRQLSQLLENMQTTNSSKGT